MFANCSSTCDRWQANIHVDYVTITDRCTIHAATCLVGHTKACARCMMEAVVGLLPSASFTHK